MEKKHTKYSMLDYQKSFSAQANLLDNSLLQASSLICRFEVPAFDKNL